MSKPYATAMTAMLSSGPLTLADRMTVWRQLARARLRELLQFDSTIAGFVTATIALAGAAVCSATGRHGRALALLTTAHRATMARLIRAPIERLLKQPPAPLVARRFNAAYDEYLQSITTSDPHRQPAKLLGTRVMVVKSPGPNERGVLVIDYTYTFPILARYFDLDRLCQRFYIVLEPSWVGFCTPEILVYSRLREPVFFETNEPVDIQFLSRVSKNFVHVQAQGNCWVDHRIFRPAEGVAKDVDVSMVSAWADYKRHAGVFAALARLRRQGTKLRTLLIGYAGDGTLTRDDVARQARYFGVADQVELQENLATEEVTRQLSRSKVHVLWSRREGFNRAIIEAMLTGVPAILRAGHNYGQHYPYINPQTGSFADESTLPSVLLHMTEHHHHYDPRGWVMANMTPQIATARLNETVKQVALSRGESWSSDIVVRTVQLKRAPYWNPEDAARFAGDYAYLASLIR
jgi:glycosyltransferase involved in cell wall biosynthesis